MATDATVDRNVMFGRSFARKVSKKLLTHRQLISSQFERQCDGHAARAIVVDVFDDMST